MTVGTGSLLARLKDAEEAYAVDVEADAVHEGMIPVTPARHKLITEAVNALPAVLRLVEAAQRVEEYEPTYSEHEEVVDPDGAPCPPCCEWGDRISALQDALAPFLSEEVQP